MKCPLCIEPDLVMSERQGVEIDYCPKCRGVWLDRGELDKIIERSLSGDAEVPISKAPQSVPPTVDGEWSGKHGKHHHGYDDHHDDHGHSQHRRKGWLRELFD